MYDKVTSPHSFVEQTETFGDFDVIGISMRDGIEEGTALDHEIHEEGRSGSHGDRRGTGPGHVEVSHHDRDALHLFESLSGTTYGCLPSRGTTTTTTTTGEEFL